MAGIYNKTWTKKRRDLDIMIGHMKKSNNVGDPYSASNKVVSKLINEVNKMEAEAMRAYILQCPGLSRDSPAIATALDAIECAERMIQCERLQQHQLIDTSPAPSLGYSLASPKSLFSESKEGYDVDVDTHREKDIKEDDIRVDLTPPNVRPSKLLRIAIILRSIFIDTPLALLFFTLVFTASASHMYRVYYDPLIDAFSWYDRNDRMDSEYTYYNRACHASDISSSSVDDFIIDPDTSTPQEAVDITNKHGMSIFPKILTPSTASKMRDFIMRRNDELTDDDAIPLISQEHRWSFPIGGDDDPAVPPILREIATNVLLQSSLDLLLGEDPAMVEFTAITSAYGAGDQHWHSDTDYSASDVHFARSFVPIYSLFIPLQDTTSRMGATSACPGTHLCGDETYLEDLCDKLNFQVNDTRGRLAVKEEDHVWKMGDGFLMHLNTYHRGPGHTDPNGAARVMLIMSISPRPEGPHFDRKLLSLGTSYSNRWDMWGITMKDLLNIERTMALPWKMLRFLGIYKPKGTNWGWDYLTSVCARLLNDQMGYRNEELVWFTEMVSRKHILLKHMIGQLPIKTVTEEGWREYFDETFERCVLVTLIAYGVSASLYILFGSIFGGGITTICRIFKLNALIGIPFLLMLHHVSITPWGQDILTGRIHESPFVKLDGSTSITHELMSEGSTTIPLAKDILIASRYNSDQLAGYYSILDHQPGNTYLSQMVADRSGDYLHSILSVAVDQIITKSKKDSRRFLLQNGNGDWSILSPTQTTTFVETALLTKNNPRLMLIKKELAILLSICKHGRKRNTAMFKKHTQIMLLSLEQSLFTHKDIPLKAQTNFNSYQQHLFIPLTKPSLKRNLKETFGQTSSFSIGDHVEGEFDGWYSGRIINIRGRYGTVLYDDGNKEKELLERLRPFVGYRQGEIVVADDGMIGKIHALNARGTVTLKLDDGSFEYGIPTNEIVRLNSANK